jgi:voltage-gated potassium channel
MKFLPAQIYHFFQYRPSRTNVVNLIRFLIVLAVMVTTYATIFHYIMEWEGHPEHSWVTGFYWTLTVMSTLGFGDITFDSDLGRIFSIIVLISGVMFLLILLPFTFIEFFYAPWMAAQNAARAPRELPPDTSGHVILTRFDTVTQALIGRLNQYHYPYVLLVPELDEALRLYDAGYKVLLGDLDNPDTYRQARVEQAIMVAATVNDRVNTNIAFTVREISETVPVMTTANYRASVDILELAGSTHVLQLGNMMGKALSRRVIAGDSLAHVIGQFDQLLIAEATVGESDMVGRTLREVELRERTGINVLGFWERGRFEIAHPDTRITRGAVLVLAGSEEHIWRYNRLFFEQPRSEEPVVIIGGGRVGRAAGRGLAERGLDYRIVELLPERMRDPEKYIIGDAAELSILERAGIMAAPAAIVTTHDDDTNIYLTIYVRRLRPDIQIITRAVLERNVVTLHRAGADIVMSYASMGSNAIITLLNRSNVLMLAEGLDIFEVPAPPALVGKSLAQAAVRNKTNCSVVAWTSNGDMKINPDPHQPIPADARLIVIGSVDAEAQFLATYVSG